jgi:hypothetical protein
MDLLKLSNLVGELRTFRTENKFSLALFPFPTFHPKYKPEHFITTTSLFGF